MELAAWGEIEARFGNALMWWRSTTQMGTSGERAHLCQVPFSLSERIPPMLGQWTGSSMSAGDSMEQVLATSNCLGTSLEVNFDLSSLVHLAVKYKHWKKCGF